MGKRINGPAIEGLDIIEDPSVELEVLSGDIDLHKLAEDETFMEEMVVVRIGQTTNPNDPPYAHLNVNGFNQIVPRGRPVQMKRKYLEVLARMKESRFTQNVPNPAMPDRIDMNETVSLVFPFELIKDGNAKGRPWLEAILAEAN